MKKWKTHNGIKVIRLIGPRFNAFLVKSNTLTILVDTGTITDTRVLLRHLKSTLKGRSLDYIFLTHTHFDHTQNAAVVQKEYNCKIITSTFEYECAENGYTPIPDGSYPFSMFLVNIARKIKQTPFEYRAFSVDIKIDTDTVLEDPNIRIITSKGHTKGSLSLIIDNEIALVGDAMYGGWNTISVFPPFSNDTYETINSWGKLLKTNAKIYLSGHGHAIKRKILQKNFLVKQEEVNATRTSKQ